MSRHHKCGRRVCFHGAFKTKHAAKKKERSVPGAHILKRRIGRKTRFLVITTKTSRPIKEKMVHFRLSGQRL